MFYNVNVFACLVFAQLVNRLGCCWPAHGDLSFFLEEVRTHKFTPKVRDSRQIQCYQKCVIRDKFNTKKNKNTLYVKKCI